MKQISTVIIILCIAVISGCSTVEPWQKGNLAKPIMAFDTDPLESKSNQHIFSSKEGSSGGYGIGGGGCGCN